MATSSSKSSRRSSTPPPTTDADMAARFSPPPVVVVVPVDADDGDVAAGARELRRGPWTVDEDLALVNYITGHGEGRWNSLAQAAGLNRTGKSCRLRWLNYLRPDVKRGNFTADEQLLILDLHSRYGNRWSKIAQHLPGRTDNEIKNYWRTRVQKHAKQLNCDANSKRFKDAMRYLWMPHLVDGQLLHAAAEQQTAAAASAILDHQDGYYATTLSAAGNMAVTSSSSDSFATTTTSESYDAFPNKWDQPSSYYDDEAAAGALYANLVRAGAGGDQVPPAANGGGRDCCWAQQETNSLLQAAGLLWPDHHQQTKAAAPAHVVVNGQHFEDAELSGWVQSFSEGMVAAETENNFWTLDEDIWKTQL